MTVKDMIAYLATLPQDATVLVREWKDGGPRYFRPRIPNNGPMLETDKQYDELCAVVGLFDNCLADTVLVADEVPKIESELDPDFFYWTVRFGVHKVWIADGFELDDDRALDMLSGDLGYAHIGSELEAKVLGAPDQLAIRVEQGGCPKCGGAHPGSC